MERYTELDGIAAKIKDKLAAVEQEKENLKAVISKADSDIEEVKQQALEAYNNADLKKYHAAQENQRALQDTKGMYTLKLQKLKEEPIIDTAEYEKDAAEIMAAMAQAEEKLEKIITEFIKKLEPEGQAMGELILQGNELLETLQVDLYKDPKALQYGHAFIRKYSNYSAVNCINRMKESALYIRNKGKGEK